MLWSNAERITLLKKKWRIKKIAMWDLAVSIFGAGPSVKEQDISKAEGEFVISVSNTFGASRLSPH